MRDVHLPGLDLNLLPALDALLRLRNVTKAGAAVGLSQPAMSRALARLRASLGDPLLVRVGATLVPTARADEIAPRVHAAMEAVRGVYRAPAFSPRAAHRVVRLAATDMHTILLAPPLMARLAAEAPGVSLMFVGYADVHQRIERGEIDFAFATSATPLPAGAASADIAYDHLSLVMRAKHPRAGEDWALSDYADVDHVGVAIFGDGQTEIDAVLAAHGLERRTAAIAPHFAAALAIVADTDFVTTVSHGLASRFAKAFDLHLARPPKEIPAALDLSIVWSRTRSGDPLIAWLRDLIIATAAQTLAPPRPRAPN